MKRLTRKKTLTHRCSKNDSSLSHLACPKLKCYQITSSLRMSDAKPSASSWTSSMTTCIFSRKTKQASRSRLLASRNYRGKSLIWTHHFSWWSAKSRFLPRLTRKSAAWTTSRLSTSLLALLVWRRSRQVTDTRHLKAWCFLPTAQSTSASKHYLQRACSHQVASRLRSTIN